MPWVVGEEILTYLFRSQIFHEQGFILQWQVKKSVSIYPSSQYFCAHRSFYAYLLANNWNFAVFFSSSNLFGISLTHYWHGTTFSMNLIHTLDQPPCNKGSILCYNEVKVGFILSLVDQRSRSFLIPVEQLLSVRITIWNKSQIVLHVRRRWSCCCRLRRDSAIRTGRTPGWKNELTTWKNITRHWNCLWINHFLCSKTRTHQKY